MPVRQVPFFGEMYRRTTNPFLTAGLTRLEADFIGGVLAPRPGMRVLDLGCGEGRHLRALAATGATLLGLDFDAEALKVASPWGRTVRGDLRALPLATDSVDAIWCWYSSLFVFEDADNERALREAARVLKPGGRLLLQSSNPEDFRQRPQSRDEVALPDGSLVVDEARFDAASGRDLVRRTLTTADGQSRCADFAIRYYSRPELEHLTHQAGLRTERVFGGVDGAPFTAQSLDLIVLAVKEPQHGE